MTKGAGLCMLNPSFAHAHVSCFSRGYRLYAPSRTWRASNPQRPLLSATLVVMPRPRTNKLRFLVILCGPCVVWRLRAPGPAFALVLRSKFLHDTTQGEVQSLRKRSRDLWLTSPSH